MVTKMFGLAAVILYVTVIPCTGQSLTCSGSTCRECISSDPSCSWCADMDFSSQRCQPYSSLSADGCTDIQNPSTSSSKPQDENVRDSNRGNKAIQIQPQRVRIATRLRKKETFRMTFRAASNYPVDLYFLFDSSSSMRKHIASLAYLTEDIGRSIGDISTNYKMAYGLFQDKVTLPFTSIAPERLKNPCALAPTAENRDCSPPYEFKHVLDMTNNIKEFQAVVNSTNITGNIDVPEGSLDAILQAVACQKRIGWREDSRKLLIYASNERFHVAGDGKIAGIVFPNDMKCHLNDAGDYTMELKQDYPSIGQLTEVVDKHEVHIIFTVTESQTALYKELSQRVPQSTVELLAETGTGNKNIKEIIEKKYKQMISEVTIVHTEVEGVDVKIRAQSSVCERKDTNVCKGIEIGQTVNFEVEVLVTSCPTSGDNLRTVEIYPESLSGEKLTLEIEALCDCECTLDETQWVKNSDICNNGNGTLKCGQCDCNAGRFGQTCECDITDTVTDTSKCYQKDSNATDIECSGAGTCVCGVCDCDEGFSGPYCECNDRSCGTFQRELCGGVRGRCRCGQCVCEPEYSGSTCGCPTSNATCLSTEGTLCSDQGECDCGECRCNEGYVGLYCENCVLCGDTVCDIPEYRLCAECMLRENDEVGVGDFEDLDCSSLTCPERTLVKNFEDSETVAEISNTCSVKLSDGCFMNFRISTKDSDVRIEVVEKKQCPEPLNVIPVVVGVVIGVVLLGLLILVLWKIITYFVDKREYSRFQEDIAKGQWAQNDNPMYKGAITTFRNPMLDPSGL